jgi:hypothetical protein
MFAHSTSMLLIIITKEPVVITTTLLPLLLAIILTPEQDHRVRDAIVAVYQCIADVSVHQHMAIVPVGAS